MNENEENAFYLNWSRSNENDFKINNDIYFIEFI